ncbi:MAG: alpha/beta hydrolase [Gammaproteobacteria bacterium]|nr:alpha/beta hydrolase [Gammaproteobacteria bacterium]
MAILNINSSKFYYELHGNGIPLVLIAGLKGEHANWVPILDALTKRYQVLIFDNRGVGQTIDSGEPFSVETMADDIMGLINKLDLKKPHLVGHSLGGAIAQKVAHKYAGEIGSIALCNTFAKFNDTGRKVFFDILMLHQANASPADIMDGIIPWAFSKKFLSPELIKIIQKASNENLYSQSLSDYSRQLQALYDFDSRHWVSTIDIPTLIIGSEDDMLATSKESQELARKISEARLVIMPTSHASYIEQPSDFVKHLDNFYNGLARQGGPI